MRKAVILTTSLIAVGLFASLSVAGSGPMPDAGLDQTVTVDTTVQLDATGSTHPSGTIAGYEWTLRTPDGRETEPDCTTCERSTFTPSLPGRYKVTLTVTGEDGVESTDTMFVYVEDAGPAVELTGDRTPDPGTSVSYTATAESPDAKLEEIAWAVEDEIVAIRSLDGTTDQSELSVAFTGTETYRVQVVVRDTNGRTAYDQLYVKPQNGTPSSDSWSQIEPSSPDAKCRDGEYFASNTAACLDLDDSSKPEPNDDSDEGPILGQFSSIIYRSSGYEGDMLASVANKDSSYVGITAKEVGIDGGEHAPWNKGALEQIFDPMAEQASRMLFGQERETISCEMEGGAKVATSTCAVTVQEIENKGETTHVNSPTKTGAYAEYGLKDVERVRGGDPTDLKDGQNATITIVIQQKEDGIVDKIADTKESILGEDKAENDPDAETSTSDSGTSGRDSTVDGGLTSVSDVGGGLGVGLQSGSETNDPADTETASSGGVGSTSEGSAGFSNRNGMGLVK